MLKIALIVVLVGACVAAPNAIVDKRQANSSSSNSSDYGGGSSNDTNDGYNWYDYSSGSSYSSFDGYSLNDYSYDNYAYSSPYYSGSYHDNYHYDPTTHHTYEAHEDPVTVRYPDKQEGGNGTSYNNNESVEFLIMAPHNYTQGTRLVLNWHDIESQHDCRYDKIEISAYGLWMKKCGTSSEPIDLGVIAADIRISFTSDSSVTRTGFEFSYQAEPYPREFIH